MLTQTENHARLEQRINEVHLSGENVTFPAYSCMFTVDYGATIPQTTNAAPAVLHGK